MSRTEKIKDARVLLLRYEGTPGIGLRVIAGTETAEFFRKVLFTWQEGDLETSIAIEKGKLIIYEAGSQEKRSIELSDSSRKVIKNLFKPYGGKVQNNNGWRAFPLASGTAVSDEPGINIISPEGINLWLRSLLPIRP